MKIIIEFNAHVQSLIVLYDKTKKTEHKRRQGPPECRQNYHLKEVKDSGEGRRRTLVIVAMTTLAHALFNIREHI